MVKIFVTFIAIVLSSITTAAPVFLADSDNSFASGKLSLLTFTMPHCGYCKQQRIDYKKYNASENTPDIWVSDKDSKYAKSLGDKFETDIYPTTWIVYKNKDGLTPIQKFRGYQPAKKLMESVDFLRDFIN